MLVKSIFITATIVYGCLNTIFVNLLIYHTNHLCVLHFKHLLFSIIFLGENVIG